MRLSGDTSAAAQVVSFMLGCLILTAGVSTILWQSREEAAVNTEAPASATLDLQAAAMLDMLLDSQGVAMDEGGDGIIRFGLSSSTKVGIDLEALQMLEAGLPVGGAVNGLVDHTEVVESMGVDPEKYGVHLRITPKVLKEDLQLQQKMASVPTALVADWQNIAKVTVPLGTDAKMVNDSRVALDLKMASGAVQDRQMLAAMGLDFDNRLHLAANAPEILVDLPWPLADVPLSSRLGDVTLLPGDVYVDDKNYLRDVLPNRLAQYDLLVIGSNVDHKAMADTTIKAAIHQWVKDGGMLVVLGSPSSAQSWLDPMLTAVAYNTGVAGPMVAPDPTHGALTRPYALQWQKYTFPGAAWNVTIVQTPGHAEFTHPLRAGGHSVLAISDDGVFGQGRIAFTSLPVSSVWNSVNQKEAQDFFVNVLVYMAFPPSHAITIDWGDPIPDDLPVALAYRTTQADYPGYGRVILEAELLLWEKHA